MVTMRSTISRLCMTAALAALLGGCAAGGGVKDSDPHMTGKRDMNYDHLIVPGDRIGPVGLGTKVGDVVQHLGEPDNAWRSTFRGPGYDGDEVYYSYDDECIEFTWMDVGLDPTVENGLRGINVNCAKWATSDGLRVGMPIKDVISHLGQYCPDTRDDGTLLVETKAGIWFEAPNRNGVVTRILLMPTSAPWNCSN